MESDYYVGSTYPVCDSCDQPGDPENGCLLTNATYYYGESYIKDYTNKISIQNAENSTLFSLEYPKNISYILDPENLGCLLNT